MKSGAGSGSRQVSSSIVDQAIEIRCGTEPFFAGGPRRLFVTRLRDALRPRHSRVSYSGSAQAATGRNRDVSCWRVSGDAPKSGADPSLTTDGAARRLNAQTVRLPTPRNPESEWRRRPAVRWRLGASPGARTAPGGVLKRLHALADEVAQVGGGGPDVGSWAPAARGCDECGLSAGRRRAGAASRRTTS